ncbi:MAG: hypothetical protein QOG57_6934 [Pseudonocardiales bacterium]|jgi:hypothetical protein|nr:hypothetical protein [Pseudonocardiales bacterium]
MDEQSAAPEDKGFEAHPSDQLDRLIDGQDEALAAHHPYAALARELTSALVETGFDLQHRAPQDAVAGVCLTPSTDGVTIAWIQHTRQTEHHAPGNTIYEEIQQTMNYALADVLTALGFEVEEGGQDSANIVTGRREHR